MTNVVGLRGELMPSEHAYNPDVIAHLEWLLEAAKSGQIVGIAAVYGWVDETVGWRRAGLVSLRSIGALEVMKSKMVKDLED